MMQSNEARSNHIMVLSAVSNQQTQMTPHGLLHTILCYITVTCMLSCQIDPPSRPQTCLSSQPSDPSLSYAPNPNQPPLLSCSPIWHQSRSASLHNTAQHSIAKYHTAPYCTAQPSTTLLRVAQHSPAQPSTAHHSTAQHTPANTIWQSRTAHTQFPLTTA